MQLTRFFRGPRRLVDGESQASRAAIYDLAKGLRATRFIPQQGAHVEDSTAGALTITAAMVKAGKLLRDCAGAGRSDVLPTAQLLVAALQNPQVGDELSFLIVNCSDAAETVTVVAGAGGAFPTLQIAATRIVPQNTSRTVRIRLTNVTSGAEAYVCVM